MSVNAKFIADFTGFNDAVKRADDELKKLGISATGTEKSLDKMVQGFSGAKVIADATKMAEAVELVGGASKLTEAELQQVAAKASEASAKLKAMGVEVPPKIKDLADQLNKAPTALEKIAFSAGAALGGLISFQVIKTLFVDLVKGAIDFASQLDDLGKATGINTTTLQELGFAGKRVGLTMEEIGSAAGNLSKRLATGDASAVGAVQALGLNLKTLKSLDPGELFVQMAESVGKISDPLQQAGIGSELFGKKFQDVLKLAKDGLRETMAQADAAGAVLNKDTIKTLDDFGDSIGDLTLRLKVLAAEALGPAVGWLNRMLGIAKETSRVTFIDPKEEENFKKFGAAVGATGVNLEGLGPKLTIVGKAAEDLAKGNKDAISSTDLIANRLKALRESALEPLSAVQKQQIADLKKWGESEKNIAALVGASEQAVHVYAGTLQKSAEATKQSDAETKRLHETIRKLENGSLPGLSRGLTAINDDVRASLPPLIKYHDELDRIERSSWSAAFGMKGLADGLEKVGTKVEPVSKDMITFVQVADEASRASKIFGASIGKIWQGLSGGNGIAGVFEGIGKGAVEGIGHALTAGIQGLISLGINQVGKLFGKLFGNPEKEINPIRQAFVDAAGGLDVLNQKAAAAGVTLTALLDAKNPEQYKKAIDDLNAAFTLSDRAMDAANATVEKFGLTIDQLGPKFKQQKLDEQAAGLVNDYKLLDAVAKDHSITLEKLAPSVSAYIDTILKAGGTVPEELKEPIEQMRKLGLLTDASGEKFTDAQLDGLTFAQTLDAKFTTLIGSIQELVNILTKQLGPAIDGLPTEHTVHIGYQVDDAPRSIWSGDVKEMAMGGSGRVTKPTLFYSAGNEDFAFSGEGKRFGGGGGGSPVVVNVNVDGYIDSPEAQRNLARIVQDQMMQTLDRRSRGAQAA